MRELNVNELTIVNGGGPVGVAGFRTVAGGAVQGGMIGFLGGVARGAAAGAGRGILGGVGGMLFGAALGGAFVMIRYAIK